MKTMMAQTANQRASQTILNKPAVCIKDNNYPADQNDHEEIIDNQEDINNEEEMQPPALYDEQEIIFENASGGNDKEMFQVEESDESDEALTTNNNESVQEDNPQQHQGTSYRQPNLKYTNDYYTYTNIPSSNTEEYSHNTAKIIDIVMSHYSQVMDGMMSSEAHVFIQTYSLKKGIKQFGGKEKQAVHEELMQLHNQNSSNQYI
eukprot:9803169-Ditylum_brightwellii.AAC.1